MSSGIINFSIIIGAIAYATPIVIAAVGGVFGERAGVVNIGLEGLMLTGAFTAAVSTYYTNDPWIGVLIAILVTTLFSLIHAYLCIELKIDHVVSGLAINIFAANITVYLMSSLFGNKGTSPKIPVLPQITIPVFENIPVIGQLFRNQYIITIFAVFLVAFAYLVLYKTKFGLHVISVGENPKAAHVLGINVKRVRYQSVMIGGLCCGIAGSFLSISYLDYFSKNMTAGIGFIAIAAMIFGKWNPLGILAAGCFFGFANAMQVRLQGVFSLPIELVHSIPYILTILVIAGIVGKAIPPAASGKSFEL